MSEESTLKQKDPRHEARKVALGALFSFSFLSDNAAKDPYEAAQIAGNLEADLSQAKILVTGVLEKKEELDKIIQQAAKEWPVAQIAKVDLNCLRIAVFELLHLKSTPPKVAIDEAVELGKEFGSESSGGFVNGVLGAIVDSYNLEK